MRVKSAFRYFLAALLVISLLQVLVTWDLLEFGDGENTVLRGNHSDYDYELRHQNHLQGLLTSTTAATSTTTVKPKTLTCEHPPKWQKRFTAGADPPQSKTPKYFLTEILKVRIYADDKSKWTIRELKQWLHYMFWAGVEHVYLCDHWLHESESVKEPLKEYIHYGLISYIRLPRHSQSRSDQILCYRHVVQMSANDSWWQLHIDMDEYPFVMADQDEGFLVRYLDRFPDVISEVSMHNYLMLGEGERNRTAGLVIDRINRMTPKKANKLDKPITRPDRIHVALHHNRVKKGKPIAAKDGVIRMLHYWGNRHNPSQSEVMKKTVEFNKARDTMTPVLVNSLLCWGETDAFSNKTGP